MTTIIKPGNNDSSGAGIVVGIIVAILIAILFFVFALPAIRGQKTGSANINVEVPNPVNSQQ